MVEEIYLVHDSQEIEKREREKRKGDREGTHVRSQGQDIIPKGMVPVTCLLQLLPICLLLPPRNPLM